MRVHTNAHRAGSLLVVLLLAAMTSGCAAIGTDAPTSDAQSSTPAATNTTSPDGNDPNDWDGHPLDKVAVARVTVESQYDVPFRFISPVTLLLPGDYALDEDNQTLRLLTPALIPDERASAVEVVWGDGEAERILGIFVESARMTVGQGPPDLRTLNGAPYHITLSPHSNFRFETAMLEGCPRTLLGEKGSHDGAVVYGAAEGHPPQSIHFAGQQDSVCPDATLTLEWVGLYEREYSSLTNATPTS